MDRCSVCRLPLEARRRTRRFCSGACRQAAYRNGIRPARVTVTESGPGWNLRLGAYQDALRDVVCDALIADPPYSARTHAGHNGAIDQVGGRRRALSYASWSEVDVRAFCRFWSPRTRGWIAVLSCSELAPVWRAELERVGRYTFASLAVLIRGMSVRLTGDGPSSWSLWLTVARPRSQRWLRWGTLPGGYDSGRGAGGHIGGKPLELMRQIVRDYSRPGDLVCDPVAGMATTGIAAAELGRSFMGAELDANTYQRAAERLRAEVRGEAQAAG
jgi:site-specific DNA-methyltransferase (adenine-specific)